MNKVTDYLNRKALTVIPPQGTLIQVLTTGEVYMEAIYFPPSGDFPDNRDDICAFRETIRHAGFAPRSVSTQKRYHGTTMHCDTRLVTWMHPEAPQWCIRIKEDKWKNSTPPVEV